MCFYDDADWYASVCDVTEGPADKPCQCWECGAKIKPGDMRKHVYQQEHEECQRCEYEELDEDEEPCETHEYGEIFECNLCDACCKILRAIYAVEEDEGCPEYARQPMFGELKEAIWNDDDGRYAQRAVAMFPELSSVEWLTKYLVQ